eukprot:m.151181 g.151181  ORF g.151181 m.151181 type:complete len:76 (+) comp15035_c0_seq14:1219-1446(+)
MCQRVCPTEPSACHNCIRISNGGCGERMTLQQADHVHHVQEVVICQHEACSSKNGKGVKKTPLSGEYMNNKINVQ